MNNSFIVPATQMPIFLPFVKARILLQDGLSLRVFKKRCSNWNPTIICKNIGKIVQVKKSCNHKRNINRIFNEKLHYSCLQQLPTVRLKILGNFGERKWKAQTRALYPVFSLKVRFYSYLDENSQKATLSFYFKSRFSVKPSKFETYFANDCRWPIYNRLYVRVLFSKARGFIVLVGPDMVPCHLFTFTRHSLCKNIPKMS